jgi:predicted SnoaL-like aldol condensation-catalyzing enzyme
MNRKEIATNFLRLAAYGNVREAYAQHIHPNFRHHNPYYRGDAASLKAGMEENAVAMPNKLFEVQRVLEDGDLVAVHSRIQLKADMPEIAVVHIFRFEGDEIIEAWDIGQQAPQESPNENGMF